MRVEHCLRCGSYMQNPTEAKKTFGIRRRTYICENCSSSDSGKFFAHFKFHSFAELLSACYGTRFQLTRAKLMLVLLQLVIIGGPLLLTLDNLDYYLFGPLPFGIPILSLLLTSVYYKLLVGDILLAVGRGEDISTDLINKLRRQQFKTALPMIFLELSFLMVQIFATVITATLPGLMTPLLSLGFLVVSTYVVLGANIEKQLHSDLGVSGALGKTYSLSRYNLIGMGTFFACCLGAFCAFALVFAQAIAPYPSPSNGVEILLTIFSAPLIIMWTLTPALVAIRIYDNKLRTTKPMELELTLFKLASVGKS